MKNEEKYKGFITRQEKRERRLKDLAALERAKAIVGEPPMKKICNQPLTYINEGGTLENLTDSLIPYDND